VNFLIDATLRMSLVVLAALGTASALRRRSAALRHWVLVAGLVSGTALPVFQAALPSWRVAPVSLPGTGDAPRGAGVETVVEFRQPAKPVAPTATASAGEDWSRHLASLPAILLGGWLAGAFALALKLGVGLRGLRRAGSGAKRLTSGPLVGIAEEIREAIGLRRPVTLLQGSDAAALATWGVLRPRLILPADAASWPADRARVVLRHELAHVVRGDWLAQLLAESLRAAFWFNPLFWVACRRVRHESERACDDAVLASGVGAADYAAHLLELARRARPRAVQPALAMARPSSLEGRVRAMLSTTVSRRPLKRATRFAALAAFVALALPVAVAQGRFWSFTGRVVDQMDRGVPDAVLVLANQAARSKYEVRTDSTGRFAFAGLPPADYTLSVQKPGFKPINESIVVSGGDLARTVQLHVGTVQESIRVEGPRAASPADPERQAKREQAVTEARGRVAERCAGGAGEAGGQIVPPMKLVDVRPDYPEALKAAGIAGEVTLQAVIGADGTVRDVTRVSAPHPDLERLAIEAVRQWEFTPAYLNCTPVELEMQVTVKFAGKREKR
jgi:TonB family protein